MQSCSSSLYDQGFQAAMLYKEMRPCLVFPILCIICIHLYFHHTTEEKNKRIGQLHNVYKSLKYKCSTYMYTPSSQEYPWGVNPQEINLKHLDQALNELITGPPSANIKDNDETLHRFQKIGTISTRSHFNIYFMLQCIINKMSPLEKLYDMIIPQPLKKKGESKHTKHHLCLVTVCLTSLD